MTKRTASTAASGSTSAGETPDHLDRSIYQFILRHTRRDQIILLILTAASMPLVYYSLEVPKLIINKAIGAGTSVIEVAGYSLTQIQYLLVLSFLFLFLVIINGVMKYIINVYRGVLGERMLRRFRFTLYSRILRFPLPHFRNVSSSEMIPMVTAETEPLGGFIGDAIALPAFQGGLLITYLSFIFVQDVWLGIAAIALYPPQVYLIPRLQRRVNELSKQRIQHVRRLADRIGETAAGVADVRVNDTGYLERADISHRLGAIFEIRKEIYKRKFFIKFMNNFLAQLTPFFFYSIGGYLVLKNQLSLGALVAVLAAYKDISPPWKELLKFYQITEDTRVKYAQIIEQFAPGDMHDHLLHTDRDAAPASLNGALEVRNLSYSEDQATVVDDVNFSFERPQHTVVLSRDGTAANELAQLLARLLSPGSGTVTLGGQPLRALPDSVVGRRIGYCSADSGLFNTSIRDNLYYGLKHYPVSDEADSGHSTHHRKESRASGNSTLPIDTDWVDIAQSGASSPEEFEKIVYDIIESVELDDELLTLSLRTTESLPIPDNLASKIVTQRDRLIEQINAIEAGGIIEPLDPQRYILNLTVEENLLFGTPLGETTAAEFLEQNPMAAEILRSGELDTRFAEVGLELARLMVELFSDVPDDSELFEQFSFIRAGDLDTYQALITEADNTGLSEISVASRTKLGALTLKLCPARHRLGLIDEPIQDRILAARLKLMKELGPDNEKIQFYDMQRYNPGMSIQENLLFGKIYYSKGHLQPKVTEAIKENLKAIDMDRAIVVAGLDCQAGAGGSRLSAGIRRKLVLARALLKNPDLLIVNNALSGLDNRSTARIIDRVLDRCRAINVIWFLNDPALLTKFDHAILIERNGMVFSGPASEAPEAAP